MAVLLKMISYRFHLLVKYSTTLRITDGIATIAATKPDTKPAAPVSTATQAVGTYTDIPLTNMRKVNTYNLHLDTWALSQCTGDCCSLATIKGYHSSLLFDVFNRYGQGPQVSQRIIYFFLIVRLRQAFNQKADGKFKLSVNDFILKAAALSLKAVPEVNSGWTDTAIRRY
jgi:hypothetical protein